MAFLADWKIPAIGLAVILALGLFYLWAYDRGHHACELSIVQAGIEAQEKWNNANAYAVRKELRRTQRLINDRADMLNEIGNSHETDDDAPAVSIVQRTFERLRALDRQADQD